MGGKLAVPADPFPGGGVTSDCSGAYGFKSVSKGTVTPRAPLALCSVQSCGSRDLTCAFGPTTANRLAGRHRAGFGMVDESGRRPWRSPAHY